MAIFGLVLAAISVYMGFHSMSLIYLLPVTVAGIVLYCSMRREAVVGMLQSGTIRTIAFLAVTQILTWLSFYGIGKLVGIFIQ